MCSMTYLSPSVILDDSPDDAVLKALHPSRAGKIRGGWPFNRGDLTRLLTTLMAWKGQRRVKLQNAEVPIRDVLLVSGGSSYGMVTTITQKLEREGRISDTRFRQIVLPPVTDTPRSPACELKGHIDEGDTMSYSHSCFSGRGFGVARISILEGDAEGGRGTITGDVLSVSERKGDAQPDSYELTQKLMRLPAWIESALREAYATAEDSGSDDEDDIGEAGGDGEKKEAKDVEDPEEKTKQKSGLLGSGALAARRALKQVFLSKSFRTAVTKTYERYASEDGGILKPQLLEALRHFFYKRAPPDVRNVVPNPDDEMSTAAIVYLCLTFQMRNYQKDRRLVKQAFIDLTKGVIESALILRSEF